LVGLLARALGTAELIRFALGLSVNVSLNISPAFSTSRAISKGITRVSGDGETEVERAITAGTAPIPIHYVRFCYR